MNSDELRIAREIRRALNESLENIPNTVQNNLRVARIRAVQQRRIAPSRVSIWAPALALVGMSAPGERVSPWFARVVTLLPAVAMVLGLSVVYDNEMQAKLLEKAEVNAEIDAMVLSDELPIQAYTDAGFAGYLARQEQQSVN